MALRQRKNIPRINCGTIFESHCIYCHDSNNIWEYYIDNPEFELLVHVLRDLKYHTRHVLRL